MWSLLSFMSIALQRYRQLVRVRRGIDVSSIMEWGDRSGRLLSVRYVLVRYDEASKGLVPLS